eukprot:m.343984 g.343984  ORF g.343984 m.343984 type:complete len:224 (-) comp55785_c0_seq6:2006-2677(-)
MFALRCVRAASVVGGAARGARGAHALPALAYDYGQLEPFISADIMKIHHTKHHQAYVTNLNVAEEQAKEAAARSDLSQVIALQGAIKFNGGGHLNHSIFWTNLAPKQSGGGSLSDPELEQALVQAFGSVQAFKDKFAAKSAAVQGSGWGWLGYNKESKKIELAVTANQDPLQATTGLIPILGVDVWEHAYYLQYKNVRMDYLKAIWEVVNWKNVAERLKAARA